MCFKIFAQNYSRFSRKIQASEKMKKKNFSKISGEKFYEQRLVLLQEKN